MNDTDETAEFEDEEVQNNETKNLESLPMAERLTVCEDCVCVLGGVQVIVVRQECKMKSATTSGARAKERASAENFTQYLTPYPTSMLRLIRRFGCSHKTCLRCKTHLFCLYASYLTPECLYTHYKEISFRCYDILWELELGG